MITTIIFDWNGTLYDKEKGELYPGAKDVLAKVKKTHKLGLVSRGDEEVRAPQLDAMGVAQFFESMVFHPEKTEAEIKRCLAELGAMPQETLVVDDRIVRGILAGNHAGCLTCWVRQGKFKDEMPSTQDEQPTFVIDSIRELVKLL